MQQFTASAAPVRGIVCGEFGAQRPEEIEHLIDLAQSRCRRLRLVAVAEQSCGLEPCATYAGINLPAMRDERLAEAAAAARAAMLAVADGVAAEHCVADSWRRVLAVVSGEPFDVVIAARPRRYSDRAQLRWFARSAAAEIVVVAPARRSAARPRTRQIGLREVSLV